MRNLTVLFCVLVIASGCRKSSGDSGSVKSAAKEENYTQCVVAAGKNLETAKSCDPTSLDDCISILKTPLGGSNDLILECCTGLMARAVVVTGDDVPWSSPRACAHEIAPERFPVPKKKADPGSSSGCDPYYGC